jgi:MYXO-CTERM domain-containing protein
MVLWTNGADELSTRWFDVTTGAPLADEFGLPHASQHYGLASSAPGQYLYAFETSGNPDEIEVAMELAIPNGEACPVSLGSNGIPDPPVPGDACLSGVCAAGICCDRDCTGICETCTGVHSTEANGTCGLISAGSAIVCRAGSADGICDPSETCNGGSPDCPDDAVEDNTFVCRPGTLLTCDVQETCTGNAGEDCPADVRADDGTSCDDLLSCNGAAMCMSGNCLHTPAPDCDDNDPCTADSCTEASGCVNDPIPGCGEDAGTPNPDAAARPDAAISLDGGLPDLGIDIEDVDSSSCNCTATGPQRSRATESFAASLFLVALLFARRRR